MKSKLLKSICGSPEKPLIIGNIKIPCYILENEMRVLTRTGVINGIGMAKKGTEIGSDRLVQFLNTRPLKPFVSEGLKMVTEKPIEFRIQGTKAYGYPATIISEICDVVLDARSNGTLLKQQEHIAKRCELLVRAFSKVGIIALIDEATGYQKVREHDALQKILDKYLLDNARKWAKTFPDDFWYKLAKIKGYSNYEEIKHQRFVGSWINDLVYSRLAPRVIDKLKEINPTQPNKYRKHKHHSFLTEDHGIPELRDHLILVMGLMDAFPHDWNQFIRALNRARTKFEDTIPLDLPESE